MPYVKKADYERLQAAEKVCWTVLLMMHLGCLEPETLSVRTEEGRDNRKWLGDDMQVWADLALPEPAPEPAPEPSGE